MTRTTIAAQLPLVVVLALVSSRSAVAGPPIEPSSATKLDKVEDGLRHYYQQKSDDRRVELLKRLAPSKDPRMQAVLEAARSDSSEVVAEAAGKLLAQPYSRVRYFLIDPPPALPLVRPPPPLQQPSGPPET